MSLLLDALKKAADDKKKVVSSGSSCHSDIIAKEQASESYANVSASRADIKRDNDTDITHGSEVLALVPDDAVTAQVKTNGRPIEELTLDVLQPESEDAQIESDASSEESRITANDFIETALTEDASGAGNKSTNKEPYSISDDGLSLLIYKTNRDVKKNKKIILFSLLMTGLVILVSGGMFYYFDLQADIEVLERKHRIAMQSMQLKTNREKVPDNSAIIQNLVSDDSSLNEKVEFAKKQLAEERSNADVRRKAGAGKPLVNNRNSGATLSIKKVNKKDPVGENLDAAWAHYENGHYAKAEDLYSSVLVIEKNNRDALLGLAAIAVIGNEKAKARSYYRSLLEQDPRDPIATAALSSLRSDQSSLATDKIYLQSMLEKNSGSHQLNFELGNIYAQQNNWQSAQKYYFEAWKNNKNNADYLFNLAVSMDHLDKKKQALTFYKDSLIKSDIKRAGFSRDAVKKRINELSRL